MSVPVLPLHSLLRLPDGGRSEGCPAEGVLWTAVMSRPRERADRAPRPSSRMPECVSQTQCSSVPGRGTPTKSVRPALTGPMRLPCRPCSAVGPLGPDASPRHTCAARAHRASRAPWRPSRVEGVLDRGGSVTTTTSEAPRRVTSSRRVGRGSSPVISPVATTACASSSARVVAEGGLRVGVRLRAVDRLQGVERLAHLEEAEVVEELGEHVAVGVGGDEDPVRRGLVLVQGDDLVDVDRLERLLGEHDDRRRGAAVDLLALPGRAGVAALAALVGRLARLPSARRSGRRARARWARRPWARSCPPPYRGAQTSRNAAGPAPRREAGPAAYGRTGQNWSRPRASSSRRMASPVPEPKPA